MNKEERKKWNARWAAGPKKTRLDEEKLEGRKGNEMKDGVVQLREGGGRNEVREEAVE